MTSTHGYSNGNAHLDATRRIDGRCCRAVARGAALVCILARCLAAQELQPRAYVPAPSGLTFLGVSYGNSAGGLLFDPSLPVEDGHVNANVVALSAGQTFNVFGRTTQVLAIVPYVVANLSGTLGGGDKQFLYRSGLGDMAFRYSMNIYGAPSMTFKEFPGYRQKTVVGASVTVSAPTGQYDPNRLINIGASRWAFKPELGVSHGFGKWTLEGDAGVWLFTANDRFYPTQTRTQDPLVSLQGHLVRSLPHRIWVAFDGVYFAGAISQIDGHTKDDRQSNVRIGATLGVSVSRRQMIRVTFFDGAMTRVGADIRSIGISYSVTGRKGRFK